MSLHSFDDIDDLFKQMRQDQLSADRSVRPWQASIKPGDYVFRPGPEFFIFSEILPDPDPRQEGLQYFRFTRSYSIACENGELGDVHVSTIEGKLTPEEFQTAKSHQWHYEPKDAIHNEVERRRIARISQINSEAVVRQELELRYDQIWDTSELAEDFEVLGFLAPYCIVKRKSDCQMGSLEFQHNPRFYFNFETDDR